MSTTKRQTFTQKWAVASFFGDLPAGFEFHKTNTPLHATLAGVFSINLNGQSIADILSKHLKDANPFSIKGEQIEQWGEISVTTIKDSAAFNSLYKGVQNVLLKNGAAFNEPQYLADGFCPHVTVQKSEKLQPGEKAIIDRVSLVDMFPNNDGTRRRITTTFKLKNYD
ncbi:MAG: hypothetical protein U5L95_05405 [Candidatus Saccharibacteria bacterium]|nr:hypothetical protein [Candidatus Saccharibacteria bacterium]